MQVKCYPKHIVIKLGPGREFRLSWKEYEEMAVILEHIRRAYELNSLDYLEFRLDEREGVKPYRSQ